MNLVLQIHLNTINDFIADGPFTGTLTIAPVAGGASEYTSLSAKSITVNTTNPNVPGFTLNNITDTDIFEGNTKTLNVKLTSKPSSPVTVTATSANSNKITVSEQIELLN